MTYTTGFEQYIFDGPDEYGFGGAADFPRDIYAKLLSEAETETIQKMAWGWTAGLPDQVRKTDAQTDAKERAAWKSATCHMILCCQMAHEEMARRGLPVVTDPAEARTLSDELEGRERARAEAEKAAKAERERAEREQARAKEQAEREAAFQARKPQIDEDTHTAHRCGKCSGTGIFALGTLNGRLYSNTGFDCWPCNGTGWIVRRKPGRRS